MQSLDGQYLEEPLIYGIRPETEAEAVATYQSQRKSPLTWKAFGEIIESDRNISNISQNTVHSWKKEDGRTRSYIIAEWQRERAG